MRRFRGAIAALTAAMGVASLGGAAALGCSSSSSSGGEGTSDGGPDVTTDTRNDVVVVNEGGADVTDAGSEAADAQDAGDVGTDGDGGVVLPAAIAFAQAEATAICTAYKSCCAEEDASPMGFDLPNCVANFDTLGWEGNLAKGAQTVYANGHVVVDETKATACLQAIGNLPCPMQTAAQWSAITSACELVLTGNIPNAGTGCTSSFECITGTFCDTTADGGVCHPLVVQGGACDTVIKSTVNPIPDEMCSYLGSGTPALYCDLIDPPTSANYQTCQPLLPVGATCQSSTAPFYYDDQACVSTAALCGDNLECGGTASYPYSGTCEAYPLPADAGGGG